LTVVADPFAQIGEGLLRECFRDTAVPFKKHYIVDPAANAGNPASAHHRKYARKSLEKLGIEVAPDPTAYLDEWVSLYENLVRAKHLSGIKAFSRRAFAIQLKVPGMIMFRALAPGRTESIATHLWYLMGEVAYFHLAALAPEGYAANASYALLWTAIGYFRSRARRLDLGGGAGTSEDPSDGLSWFKRGWATSTRTAWLCGRIFNREAYDSLVGSRRTRSGDYFPAYRAGESD